MDPGVLRTPSTPIGICGIMYLAGVWGWVSWVSLLWRSGSESAGKGRPVGPRKDLLLSQASSTPVPTQAPVLRSYSDSRVLPGAWLLLLLLRLLLLRLLPLLLPPPLPLLRKGTGGTRNKPQTTN